jgi:hypothetical protein
MRDKQEKDGKAEEENVKNKQSKTRIRKKAEMT